MPEHDFSNLMSKIEEIRNRTSLKTRLSVYLTMADYENWDNGEYLGDENKIREEVNYLIDLFEDWTKRGQPGGFEKYSDQGD